MKGAFLLTLALMTAVTGTLAAQNGGHPSPSPLTIREYPVLTDARLKLLKEYAEVHFGVDSVALVDPKMIVVHFTAMSSLTASLSTFKRDTLPSGRTDIAGHGDVNVGIHYVIAKDGTIYRLQPENIIGRHTIGFNWCAIGIEMVAKNEQELTAAELSSCAALCAWIASRHASIEYLIGHHEYMRRDLPHFALYIEKDPSYMPTVKDDPGDGFMNKLRQTILTRYSLTFKE